MQIRDLLKMFLQYAYLTHLIFFEIKSFSYKNNYPISRLSSLEKQFSGFLKKNDSHSQSSLSEKDSFSDSSIRPHSQIRKTWM